jgi:hypothetical protein
VAIENLMVLSGSLPPRAMGLVAEWATLHRDGLRVCWQRATNLEPPGRIPPLP